MRAEAFAAAIAFGLLLLASGNARSDSCDCSKCNPSEPINDCGPLGKACCPPGGVPLCTTPDGCCSNAECPGGGQCVVGKCVCPSGKTLCGGKCVDNSNDDFNCGACGHTCGDGKCCSGQCVPCPISGVCIFQQAACHCPLERPTTCDFEGTPICVNLTESPRFCGSCGRHCRTGEDGGEVCCNGECVNPLTNAANCGSCGSPCPTGGNTNFRCCNGVCEDVNNDPKFCGNCAFSCARGQRCLKGKCLPPCGRNQTCGTGLCACPPATVCDGRRCIPAR